MAWTQSSQLPGRSIQIVHGLNYQICPLLPPLLWLTLHRTIEVGSWHIENDWNDPIAVKRLGYMANQRLSGKNQIRLESMAIVNQELPLCVNLLAFYEPMSEATLFHKYKEGKALANAPFKLCELHALCPSTDEEYSPLSNKNKMRGPYRKYTCQQKLEAVQCIQSGQDVNIVSKRYGIPRRNLLRWRKFGCERKEGGGRSTDEEMEQVIQAKIKQGELTDEKQIRQFAVGLSKMDSFKASKGWFTKFCQRNEAARQGSPISQVIHGDIESTDSFLT